MNKIYAQTIQLGNNMWHDKEEIPPQNPSYLYSSLPYRPVFNKDKKCLRQLVDHAANEGMNTIVIHMGEGYSYKSHPEIALDGAWTEDELKAELAHIREMGLEPVPMLNFSAAHDMWLGKYERMVGTDTYQKVCLDLIDEVCALFDTPKYFHIGMDEETYDAQKYLDFATVRNSVVMNRDLTAFLNCIRKNGVTPWMFCDYYKASPKDFLAVVDKDVLLSDMHIRYSQSKNTWPTEIAELTSAGYQLVPMMTHHFLIRNSSMVMNYLKQNVDPKNVKGIINFPILFCEQDNYYKLIFETSQTMRAVNANAEYFK